MPLTPEQIQQMELDSGVSKSLSADKIAQMDIDASGGDVNNVASGGLFDALAFGANRAIPFGGDISSALGAGIAKVAGDDRSFGELFQEARDFERETLEEHPFAGFAGTGLGIAATLPAASTKVLSGVKSEKGLRGLINEIPQGLEKVGSFVRGSGSGRGLSNIAGQSLRGSAVAAPTLAAFGAGEAETGERIEGAKEALGVGLPVVAALPVAGAGLAAAGGAIKSAIPKVDEGLIDVARIADKFKIPLSVDQITGSRAVKAAQKVSQDLPFSGQNAFRDQQLSAFHSALNKTIGQDADKITPKIMDKAFKDVGKKFDIVERGKKFDADSLFDKVTQIANDADITANSDARENFQKAVDRMFGDVGKDNKIRGEALGFHRKKINSLARKTNNQDTRELLLDLENAIIEEVTSGDLGAKKDLLQAKQIYKNLLVIEPLAAKTKSGFINPTQLINRVSRIYGRQFVRGKAGDIGQLARVGNELLVELGGSDTASKSIITGMVAGGAWNHAAILPMLGGLAVNKAVQEKINRNPKIVKSIIDATRKGMIDDKRATKLIEELK